MAQIKLSLFLEMTAFLVIFFVGVLWVGTDKGLAVLDTTRTAFRRYAVSALGASVSVPSTATRHPSRVSEAAPVAIVAATS